MFSLIVILLVVFVVLSLLLAAWTLFFQGYIYSEPVSAIYWRAPAAAGALTFFLLIWVIADYRSVDRTGGGHYHPLHDASTRETERYEKLTIVTQDRRRETYKLQGNNQYVSGNRRLAGLPLEIVATDKSGQDHVFKPKPDARGVFEKVDGQVRYYEEGNPRRYMDESALGQITIFHFTWLLGTLFLNFGFLAVWFVCLWLLLRFQWAHALGLAFAAWLISLFILPMILTQAENVAKEKLPLTAPAATSQAARRGDQSFFTHTAA